VSYRINTIISGQEAEAMVAADSFDPLVERLHRMVTAGRGMVLAVREFTYLGRPPVLYGGLQLNTETPGGGFGGGRDGTRIRWSACLTNGGSGFEDTRWFGFGEDAYEYSGNVTEAEAWKRYEEHEAEHSDHFRRRRDMTHIAFTGGLSGWKYQAGDRVVITDWNRDGVATERTLGFEMSEGSW